MMSNEQLSNSTIFPLGNKINANFIGDAYLQFVFTDPTPLNAPIGNVTFAPDARNNWHSHKIGQVLLAAGGESWYQEEGKTAQMLKTGDVVKIAPNVEHCMELPKTVGLSIWLLHRAKQNG